MQTELRKSYEITSKRLPKWTIKLIYQNRTELEKVFFFGNKTCEFFKLKINK